MRNDLIVKVAICGGCLRGVLVIIYIKVLEEPKVSRTPRA